MGVDEKTGVLRSYNSSKTGPQSASNTVNNDLPKMTVGTKQVRIPPTSLLSPVQ